jgi:hypothetical protein
MKATPEYASIPEAGTPRFLFHRQWLHLAGLVLLVPICWAFAAPALGDGEWLGFSDTEWFWASIVTAIVHQVIVAFVFRTQLGWSILTRGFELAAGTALMIPAVYAGYSVGGYFGTEAPDMALIYGGTGNSGSDENLT